MNGLDWDPGVDAFPGLPWEWAAIVAKVLAVRETMGPLAPDDPLTTLAVATAGATKASGVPAPLSSEVRSASLLGVWEALNHVQHQIADPARVDADKRVLTHAAYELAHWACARASDPDVKRWLATGRDALYAGVHLPSVSSRTGVRLVAWHEALVDAERVRHRPIVQRSVALGHLAILKSSHAVLTEAIARDAVPQAFGESLLAEIKQLGRVHQLLIGSLRHADRTAPGSEAAMLRIGTVVRDLTRGAAGEEGPQVRLDALLRSGFGQADLVARIVTPTRATFLPSGVSPLQAARPLQLAALEYIADPALLSPEPWTRPEVPVTTVPSESPEVVDVVPMARPAVVETRVAPGERLGAEAVIELCRSVTWAWLRRRPTLPIRQLRYATSIQPRGPTWSRRGDRLWPTSW